MKQDSRLAEKIKSGEFIVTAEYLPALDVSPASVESCAVNFGKGITAVNVADNHYGVTVSSLAAAVVLAHAGLEPIYQLITRDRNRIALQSDLLGAAMLGIKNVTCLSGYHQTLIGNAASANVYDIDSIQLVALVKKMNGGQLLDGQQIVGGFALSIGAVANPSLKPIEMNLLRLGKKITAGAAYIQTQAVFDVAAFKAWLEAIRQRGYMEKAAILASVMPLPSAARAKELAEHHTDYVIPAAVIDRLSAAGDAAAQRKEGAKIAGEIMQQLKGLPGLRGIHILSGGNESAVPGLLASIA